jgi:tRNA nucleotidyltransferase (CCA-adding enzyme)
MVATVFPEILPSQGFDQVCDYHFTDVYSHTLHGLNYLKQFKDPVLSVAHLFHDVSKPFCYSQQDGRDHFYGHEIEGEAVVERAMSRLKFSTKEINRAKFIVRNHMRLHSNLSKKALRRLLHDCEEAGDREFLNDLYKVHVADITGMRKQEIYPRENIDDVLTEKPDAFKCPLSGTEIIGHFGLKEGSLIGQIKNYLKERVIEGSLEVDNKEEAIRLASKFMEDLCKQ